MFAFYYIFKMKHADMTKKEGGGIFAGWMYVKAGVSVQKTDGTGKGTIKY